MALILKNTFYDVAETEEKVHARRSSSAPPSWKPLETSGDWGTGKNLASDASTTVSDDECSSMTPASLGNSDGHDTDLFFSPPQSSADESESVISNSQCHPKDKLMLWSEIEPTDDFCGGVTDADEGCESVASVTEPTDDFCGGVTDADERSESVASVTHQPPNGKQVLCLDAAVEVEKRTLCLDVAVESTLPSLEGPRTKLNSRARVFAPVPTIDTEILAMIDSAREVLQSSPDALSVKVSQGTMGGTTSLLAEVRSSSLEAATVQQTLSLLKTTLLDFAAGSEATYILGYGAQPFTDTFCGFSCVVGCISAVQEHSICWDTYEHGFCHRRNTCRWCHPTSSDLMQINVMLKETV